MRILGMVLPMIGASICLLIGAGTGLCGLLMASSYGNGALPLLRLVTMERPAPDSQLADYAVDRERTAAQSRIRMGAGDEKRTFCGIGCPRGDDCCGGGGAEG